MFVITGPISVVNGPICPYNLCVITECSLTTAFVVTEFYWMWKFQFVTVKTRMPTHLLINFFSIYLIFYFQSKWSYQTFFFENWMFSPFCYLALLFHCTSIILLCYKHSSLTAKIRKLRKTRIGKIGLSVWVFYDYEIHIFANLP